jgi:catechol 2,3-dioxygenase-like lactoylglutathione lyase family enzyme
MRLDHIAYRVRDKAAAVGFFMDAFGYKQQSVFDISLEDGSTAQCTALEPLEKTDQGMEFSVLHDAPSYSGVYHLAPEVFVSSGPPGSLIDRWVEEWGHGVGGIHHLAYQVDDVEAVMSEWATKGWLFTTPAPLECPGLKQVFSRPNPFTNVIYEFIKRGAHGFCKENVGRLMSSTKDIRA